MKRFSILFSLVALMAISVASVSAQGFDFGVKQVLTYRLLSVRMIQHLSMSYRTGFTAGATADYVFNSGKIGLGIEALYSQQERSMTS